MTDGAPRAVPRALGAVIGIAVGATAWVSLGLVGVLDAQRLTRVVALPSLPWLAALVAVGVVGGAAIRLPPPAWRPLTLLVLPWLPWLPVRVPASWLIWDGPLEGAIWLAALGGMAFEAWRAGRAGGAARGGEAGAGRRPWIAAALMAVVAVGAWAIARPRVPTGDEPHYLVITQSLLRDGDLRIEDNHRDEQHLEYFDGVLRPDFMRRGSDRQIYSIHAPGASLLVLPAFAVAGYPGAAMQVAAIVALGVALLWLAAFRLTGSPGGAWVSTLALVTAAPYVLLSFMIYPDPIGSTVVAAALLALVSCDAGLALSGGTWLGVGAALALLPWLHTRFAVLAGACGAVLLLRAWQVGRAAAVSRLLALPIASAVGWFGYFWVIYGTPDPGAPYGDGTGSGLSFVPQGLVGLFLDQQFGLVANAPALAAGLGGLALLAIQRPRLAIELSVVLLPYLAVAAAFPMWWGGRSSPARFAIVVAPVLALPAGLLWTRAGLAVRTAIVAVLVVSAGLTAAIVGVDRGAFIFNGRDGHALVLDWLSPLVDLTLTAPSVHRDGVAGALADSAVWALAVALAVAIAARLPRIGRALGWLATPLVGMSAMAVAGAGLARPVVTAPTSKMRFLDAWRDGDEPITAQLSPARRLEPGDVIGRLTLESSTRGEPAPGAPPLLHVPNVPAGEYDVFLDAPDVPVGRATVRLGRQGRQEFAMAEWRLDGLRAGYGGLVLRLPVDAHAITIVADPAARRSVTSVWLRPRSLAKAGERPEALRAARYGHVVVYALDDYAYLEPGAFWTRGERVARVVVQGDEGTRPVMHLKAGPVANEVRLRAGAWTTTVPLAPDASVDLLLPAEALAPVTLEIESRQGFRPSAFGGNDVRWLGVYVTWPDAPATP